jgi:PiT family inorganic phosphate transporter
MLELILLIAVIVVTLCFEYVNGFHDTANAIATCVSTRALSVKMAIIMAAIMNFIGALVSSKVATTIGTGLVSPHAITQVVILTGVGSAVVWGLFTWWRGIPSSSSHALIGGIIGAVIASNGFESLQWQGTYKIILALLISPIIGTGAGFLIMLLIYWLFRKQSNRQLNSGFKKLQVLSAMFMAFSHGTADAQKSMGIITMALVSYGLLSSFTIPLTVVLGCATVMALGTAAGGWRIIKTVGRDFVELTPPQGFCVETASAGVILGASAFGLPTSTTHILVSAIFGAGISKGAFSVNWKVALNIVLTMLVTVPISALMAFTIYKIILAF